MERRTCLVDELVALLRLFNIGSHICPSKLRLAALNVSFLKQLQIYFFFKLTFLSLQSRMDTGVEVDGRSEGNNILMQKGRPN